MAAERKIIWKNRKENDSLNQTCLKKNYTNLKQQHHDHFKSNIKRKIRSSAIKEFYTNKLNLNDGKESNEINIYQKKKLKYNKILGVINHFLNFYMPFLKLLSIYISENIFENLPTYCNTLKTSYIKKWKDFIRSKTLIIRLSNKNISSPLPIQSMIIPNICKGKDILCVAKTGSGKTLCFILPLWINFHTIKHKNIIKKLILSPTRELTQQIGRECYYFFTGLKINILCAFGGSSLKNILIEIQKRNTLLVTTPGKLIEIIDQQRSNKFWNLSTVVIDEADKIFDLGFEFQIKRIIMNIRIDVQLLFFTSYLNLKIEEQLFYVLKKPIRFKIGSTSLFSPLISQFFEFIQESKKYDRLLEIMSFWYELGKSIIFLNNFNELTKLKNNLSLAGYKTVILHSKLSDIDRMITLFSYRNSIINVLLSSTISSRGLDFKKVNLVVNYTVPLSIQDYVNQIGRTGRNGEKGTSITFIYPSERMHIQTIIKQISNNNVALNNISFIIR